MSLDINLTGVEITSNKKTTLTDNSDTFYPTQKAVKTAVDLKVDAVAGKGLSANDFTNTLKTKLDGIEAGAEVNVNADWNATSGDAQILNKPTIPSIAGLATETFVTNITDNKVDKVTGSRLITSAESTVLGNTSGTNTGDQDLTNLVVKNTAITGATKTKITYDSKGLVTAGADATTADIADSTNKRYVTDANLTVIGNTSGTNTGDQTLTGLGGVPTSRTVTINGTTQNLSTDITFTVGGSLTVGTTAVTSGTIGRVFFEGTGNVVQQSASLFWDNTNARLGVGATPSTSVRLDVRAQGALSTDIAFRVRNSADTGNLFTSLGSAQIIVGTGTTTPEGQILVRHDFTSAQPILTLRNGQYGNIIFQVRDERTGSGASIGSFRINGIINGGETGSTKQFDFGGHGLGASYGGATSNAVWLNNQGSVGDGTGSSVISVSSDFYINAQTTKKFIFVPRNGNFGVAQLTFGTSATNTIAIASGVAPTTSPADSFQQYSADITAGNAAPHFRTENGNVIKIYRETTAVVAAAFVSNTSLIVDDSATYGGYTMGQVVAALKAQGLLA